jgi:hypothetical protein
MSEPEQTAADGTWLMWEAKAAPQRAAALLAWVLDHAPPSGQVYRSADRVVLIIEAPAEAPTEPPVEAIADPPADLLARPAYSWRFDRVR